MIRAISSSLLLFVLFALVHSQVVTYVYNPACASSAGGCDLLTPANWNGTITPAVMLILNTNETSTFFLNDTTLRAEVIYIGISGSPISLYMYNSSLIVNSTSYAESLSWGNTTTIYATGGLLYSPNMIVGGNAVLQHTEVLATSMLFFDSLIAVGGNIGASNLVSVGSGSMMYVTVITGGTFSVTELYSNNSHYTASLFRIYGNSTFHGDTIYEPYYQIFFQEENINVEFHETYLHVDELLLTPYSRFAFHADNSNATLSVDFVTYVNELNGTEIHLGANVQASFGYGYIRNLTVDPNVSIAVNTDNGSDLRLYNVQQSQSTSATTFNVVSGTLGLWSTSPINASVQVPQNSQLYVYQLFLTPGSSINGNGTLSVYGLLSAPQCNISVPNVVFDTEYVSRGQLVVDTLFTNSISFDAIATTNGTIIGNVVVSAPTSTYGGVNFQQNAPLFVNGSYTQVGGYLNVTLQNTGVRTNPFLKVSHSVVLQSVTIVAVVGVALEPKEPWLIVSSLSNSLTATNTTVVNYLTSDYAAKLSLSTSNGNLYIGAENKDNKTFLQKYEIYIIIGGAVVGALIGIIVVLVVRRMRHSRHQYERIQH